jgi:hypothetical protein
MRRITNIFQNRPKVCRIAAGYGRCSSIRISGGWSDRPGVREKPAKDSPEDFPTIFGTITFSLTHSFGECMIVLSFGSVRRKIAVL